MTTKIINSKGEIMSDRMLLIKYLTQIGFTECKDDNLIAHKEYYSISTENWYIVEFRYNEDYSIHYFDKELGKFVDLEIFNDNNTEE